MAAEASSTSIESRSRCRAFLPRRSLFANRFG